MWKLDVRKPTRKAILNVNVTARTLYQIFIQKIVVAAIPEISNIVFEVLYIPKNVQYDVTCPTTFAIYNHNEKPLQESDVTFCTGIEFGPRTPHLISR